MTSSSTFSADCTKCSRIVSHLAYQKKRFSTYYCKPVPAFGDSDARLLIVGLAPGLHGANATGRPFTGDYAGVLLYQMLFKFGFATQPVSTSNNDTLQLKNCRITNAVKCLPPANKPTAEEVKNCNPYLYNELCQLNSESVVLALGKIAHDAVLTAFGLSRRKYPFTHGGRYKLNSCLYLLDSYHCSRYNVQTKRLTQEQFQVVFEDVVSILNRN